MLTIKKNSRSRILFITAIFTVLVFGCVFTSYSESRQTPSIIYTKNDSEYCIKASELSQSGSSGMRSGNTASANPDSRLLVVYDSYFDCSEMEGLDTAVFGDNGLGVMQFDSAEDARAAYEKIRGLEQVRSVEFDSIVVADNGTGDQGFSKDRSDGHLSWGAECIGADNYADYVGSIGHKKLIVAVVDSGVYSGHPFLTSRLTEGYDFVRGDDDPDDETESAHGTHVTGIVADCTLGFDDIMIMPIKVLNSKGVSSTNTIANGILYASEKGASVINLSLGGSHGSYIEAAVEKVISNGAVVVAASGNEGDDIDSSESCPAHIEEVITVGAVNEKLTVEGFSNYGKKLDVVAPGGNIYSTYKDGSYKAESGTSMAAPHVSACAALLRLRYPEAGCEQIGSVLKRSCRIYEDTRHYGSGIVDLRNLLADISDQEVELKTKEFKYTGDPVKPSVVVSRNKQKLFKGDDYTVTYQNNTKVGKAGAVIRGKGSYYGTKIVTFKIYPKGTSLETLTAAKKGCTVKWKKQSEQTSGYQIQYSTGKSFDNAKKKTVKGSSKTSCKLTLKSGKKYYVRIRTYKTVSGKKYYSSWSEKKSVKAR